MFPGTHVPDDFFSDFPRRQEQLEDLMFPELQEGFARQPGQRQESVIRKENSF
jgi:hypothetical protein